MGIGHYITQKGMTVKELADLAGVKEETIEKIQNRQAVTAGELVKISEALNEDAEHLFF